MRSAAADGDLHTEQESLLREASSVALLELVRPRGSVSQCMARSIYLEKHRALAAGGRCLEDGRGRRTELRAGHN